MEQSDDRDAFLYEDIAFARCDDMSDSLFLENSYGFLEYCSAYDDDDADEDFMLDDRITYIIDAWGELGYKYFYQNPDLEQALVCYKRERDLSLATQSHLSYSSPLIGSCSERMGDVYATKNDFEQALTLYREALEISMAATFVNNVMATGRCMCKIGRYNSTHEPEVFHRAFQHLIHGYWKPYSRDTVGKCYVYLAQSLQRCIRYLEALKYAKLALSIFQFDPLLLEPLIEDCCLLVIELSRSINDDHNSIPTKEELLNCRISLTDEKVKEALQMTLDELNQELNNHSNNT